VQDLQGPLDVGVSNEVTISSRADTSAISDDITHALNHSGYFDPKTISVTAEADKARLAGTVHSQHNRQTAAIAAWARSEPNVRTGLEPGFR
jgi:osmotically-inducible protein OsmY